jgi:hypothetical protein
MRRRSLYTLLQKAGEPRAEEVQGGRGRLASALHTQREADTRVSQDEAQRTVFPRQEAPKVFLQMNYSALEMRIAGQLDLMPRPVNRRAGMLESFRILYGSS